MITIPIWLYVVSCILGFPIFCIVIVYLVYIFKFAIELVKQAMEESKLL